MLLVRVSFRLLLSTVETIQVTVENDLAKYWRTTYDILVRPGEQVFAGQDCLVLTKGLPRECTKGIENAARLDPG